eukprot:gene426-393_t
MTADATADSQQGPPTMGGTEHTCLLKSSIPFLSYTDVPKRACDVLRDREVSKSDKKRFLAQDCLQVTYDAGSYCYEIAADFHFHNLQFCLGQPKFDDAKMSTFLSIMKVLYVESFCTLGLSMQDSYSLFKHMLLRHSCQRPPFSTGVFTMAEVATVTSYVLDAFYRHYKIPVSEFPRYKYVYVCTRELEVTVVPPPQVPVPNAISVQPAPPACTEENECDPRKEPMLDYLFEEERRLAKLKAIEDERLAAERAKMGFEERVMGTLARLNETVDTRLTELGATVNPPAPEDEA